MGASDDSSARVRRWNVAQIAEHASTKTNTAARRLIPAMVEAKVIAKRGRCWYGRPADIDAWLLGRWTVPTAEGSPP